MTMYALTSAGGAPGVTTAALALALTWPSRAIVAETDPGGPAVLAGLFAGHVDATRNIGNVAYEAGTIDSAAAEIASQLIDLDGTGTRLLLPGVADPRQAAAISPAWPVLAGALARTPGTVFADCGRFDGTPAQAAVLAGAARVLLVLRPSLRQVARARGRLQMLADTPGNAAPVSLLVTGPGALNPREITAVLGTPVTGVLPDDARTAAVLSDGQGRRTGLQNSRLLRAAGAAGKALRTLPEPAAAGLSGQS